MLAGPDPVEEEAKHVWRRLQRWDPSLPHLLLDLNGATHPCLRLLLRDNTFLSDSCPEASLWALSWGVSSGRNWGEGRVAGFHLLALLDGEEARPGAGKGLAGLVTAEPEWTRSSRFLTWAPAQPRVASS